MIAGTSYSNISGNKTENNLGGEQTWIIKTDALGNKQWDKTIFTIGHDEWGLAIQTHDGCYAIASQANGGIGGYKTQPSWGGFDYWIVKFCDTTLTGISTLQSSTNNLQLFPNPSNGIFQITLPNFSKVQNFGKVSCEIINTLGQKVFQSDLSRFNREIKNPKSEIKIDVSFLPKRIYVLKINNGVSALSRKFIIE